MTIPLRVLLIEDSQDDALLVLRELQRGGYEPTWERVATADALQTTLTRNEWDVVTCDWVMPHLAPGAALRLVQDFGRGLPIVIVSGEVGEEVAVTAMKAGAHDYVSKHNLARLVPAIERELREAEVRRERTRGVAALAASERRVHQQLAEIEHIYRTTPIGICFLDCDLRYVRINDWLAARNGQPVEAHLGRTIREMVPAIADKIEVVCRRALEQREPLVDLEIRGTAPATPSEQRVWLESFYPMAAEDGTLLGLHVVVVDVTDRVRAKEATQRSEQHFRALIENASDLISILGNDGTVRYVSPSHTRLLGYRPEEIVGRRAFDFVHPDDVTPLLETFQRAVLENRVTAGAEFRFRRRDGSWRHLEGIARNALDDPVIAGMIINARDISARRRAEEELRLTRDRLQTYIDQANDIIFTLDPHGRITSINNSVRETTGYSPAELLGTAPLMLVAPEARAGVAAAFGKMTSGDGQGVEIDIDSKDGRRLTFEVRGRPLWEGPRLIETFHIARDITERKRTEAELRQAQKLEAVGRLAGGIAHDFNNQLTIIMGCAQFLLGGLPLDDPRREDAQRITATVERGARLVRQLLTFSRLGPVETQPVNLSELITEIAPMLRLLLGEQLFLRIRSTPHLWPVRVDRSQIEQVLMNLVTNARDAMLPSDAPTVGQTVTIETGNVELDQWAHALPEGVHPGAYVALVVSDNGRGMPLEVRDHVFEPFFTTKGYGKGTGLGLATVYGIVKQHAGYVACASELGHGTRFEIYFPRDDCTVAQPVVSEPGAPQEETLARKSMTVLVAEDDEGVRDLLVRALAESGYWAYGAAQSEDALALAARIDGRIDLLVTDVVMPGGSGYALARRLLETFPDLRTLFVSGYDAEGSPADVPGACFLRKPFGVDELLRTIAEMLADSDAP